MRRLIFVAALAGCAGRDTNAGPSFETLCADYWDWQMRSSPEWATYEGDARMNGRLSDIGPSDREARHLALNHFMARIDDVTRGELDRPHRLSYDVLRRQLLMSLEDEQHKFWQWDVDPLDGPQVTFFQLIAIQPLRNERDAIDLAARLSAFPAYLRTYMQNLREGIAQKRVAPKVVVARVVKQLDDILAKPTDESPLMAAVKKLAEQKSEYEFACRGSIKIAIRNAFADLRRFLAEEYPARDEVGLGSLPGGLDAYRFRCRHHTTTDLTPEQIHKIGLDELLTIELEMAAIAGRLGHDGDVASFIAKVKADPANYRTTRDDLLELYRSSLAKSEALLPKWFGRLPKHPCKVKPIEEYREKDAPTAYYYSADPKHTRDAYFYANTYMPETRPAYSAMALTVHEAVPGHHFQIAIAQEIEGLPEFRRHASSTAFVEGWALYCERLADEMGLYATDLDRFGMLSYQAWRACRLVVDTGLHAMGWSREKAIRFMCDHVADSEANLTNEVDRYITWPGQATAYKIGQREILALRATARRELGSRFDIREFHDVVLGNGPLPLPILRTQVDEWILRRKS